MIRELNKLSAYIEEMQGDVQKRFSPHIKGCLDQQYQELLRSRVTRTINFMLMWQEFATVIIDRTDLIISHERNVHTFTRSVGLLVGCNFEYNEKEEFPDAL